MSRKGDSYDNAVAGHFFSRLKCELIQHYATRASAQTGVFAHLEAFHNSVRPHSTLALLAPARFEVTLPAPQA